MSETKSSGGIGFVGLLTILFIGLKLTGTIDWSWWWVLSPIWITSLACVAFVGGVLLVAACIDGPLSSRKGAKSTK